MLNLRKILKSKTLWIFLSLLITIEILVVLDIFTEKHMEIFQIILGIVMFGIFPALTATVWSVRAALILKWIHQNLINITNRKNLKYYTDKKFSEKESYRKFAAYNIWYAAGITFVLLRLSGINFENTESMMTLTVLYVLLGLIFASAINFAIILITKKAIFFQNHSDGSKINLGSDLRKIINWVLAPFQIIVFLYSLIFEIDILMSFGISLAITLGICFVASLTSYFLLKIHYIEKLYQKFESKIKI